MLRKRQPRKELVQQAYVDLKRELGRRLSYLEFHLHAGVDSRQVKQEFGSYVGFLHWLGELNGAEGGAFSKYEGWFRDFPLRVCGVWCMIRIIRKPLRTAPSGTATRCKSGGVVLPV